MNIKGQVTIGMLIVVFIGVIVGVALIGTTASSVENIRSTITFANTTITAPATVNTSIEIPGSGIVGTVIARNATTAPTQLPTNAFNTGSRQPPITSGVVTNTFELTDLGSNWTSASINLSYTAEPDGYDTSAGGRAIILLVVIFFALAIAVIALVPAARSGVMEMFKG